MPRVNRKDMLQEREKLTPDNALNPKDDAIVLTVSSFELVKFPNRKAPILRFQETGEKALWVNITSMDYLMEIYGDDSDRWIGKPVPLVRKKGETPEGEPSETLWIAPPELWSQILRDAGVRVPEGVTLPGVKVAAATVAKKRGRGK